MYRARDTNNDLWVLPMGGASRDHRPFVFLQTSASERSGVFSGDGRWVAYVSDESGADEIYVRAFIPPAAQGASPAGPKHLVSNGGGTRPRWGVDGSELFYMAPAGNVMAVRVTHQSAFDSEPPQRLFQLSSSRLWDVDATGHRFLLAIPAGPRTPAPFTVVRNWHQGTEKMRPDLQICS